MREKRIRQLFELSVALKGLHALIEIVSGLLLTFVSTATVVEVIDRLTRSELIEDPNDFLARHLTKFAGGFSVEAHHFYAFYLLSHGIMKGLLVLGLLRQKLWAYPASFVVFGAFIAYQLYRYSYTHEFSLILLSVLDLVVILLAIHEYRLLRRHLPTGELPSRARPDTGATMIRLTHDQPLPDALRGSVIALGNFDGFHLGHQAVVSRAIALGFHERRPVIVATFEPHPVRYFKPDVPPFRLTSLDQRERLFAHAGADGMLVFNFDKALASTSAEDFVAEILAKKLGVAAVVTGTDFTFGRGRAGNAEVMRTLGANHGIEAETVAPVILDGEPVSSSRIRQALAAGDPAAATHLLTRPFAIEAVVERGDGRGHDLGFPTANVSLGRYQRPAHGIYAVRVRLDDGSEHSGVASFGVRPMFDGGEEVLETYVFDWEGDLYGRTIEVDLIAYIRAEAKFDSIDALVERMREDEAEARRILAAE